MCERSWLVNKRSITSLGLRRHKSLSSLTLFTAQRTFDHYWNWSLEKYFPNEICTLHKWSNDCVGFARWISFSYSGYGFPIVDQIIRNYQKNLNPWKKLDQTGQLVKFSDEHCGNSIIQHSAACHKLTFVHGTQVVLTCGEDGNVFRYDPREPVRAHGFNFFSWLLRKKSITFSIFTNRSVT